MTLRCHFFGHRRSRSRATYDEKRGRWITECKRCFVLLERQPDGTWNPVPSPAAGKLEPIEREPEDSAPPRRSPGEPPVAAPGAADSAERSGPPVGKRRKKAVELSAS